MSALKVTFIKRYIVERTNKAEIRPEEQTEKAESCQGKFSNEIQLIKIERCSFHFSMKAKGLCFFVVVVLFLFFNEICFPICQYAGEFCFDLFFSYKWTNRKSDFIILFLFLFFSCCFFNLIAKWEFDT